MGVITPATLLGTLEYTTRSLVPWTEAYVPPIAPALLRSKFPTDDPMPPDFFLNVPIGSGITTYPTTDAIVTHIRGLATNWNTRDWTDPVFKVAATDPTCSAIYIDQYQPTAAKTALNTDVVSPAGTGLRRWKYEAPNLRIPANAFWQSINNSDRKVSLDYQYDITLTKTRYLGDGVTVDYVETTFYPAGSLRITVHKFQRVTGSSAIYGTNGSQQNLVTADDAYNQGAVASGIFEAGYVRAWEVAAALAGDKTAIKHALKCGLANESLKLGALWPARTEDSPNPPYTGPVPYGTHFFLPATLDEDAITTDPLARAILWTLKMYGAYVLIRAGGAGIVTFGTEPRGAGSALTSTQISTIKTVMNLNSVRGQYLVGKNSNLDAGTGAFTYSSATRKPNRGVQDVGGGGTRRTAGLGLADIDNTTGLKLPLSATGPWV